MFNSKRKRSKKIEIEGSQGRMGAGVRIEKTEKQVLTTETQTVSGR